MDLVKYLYKYIYKGHDYALTKIVENSWCIVYNETKTYVDGRCITPTEACWRIFCCDIQRKSHVVQRSIVHLPGNYLMQNISRAQEDLVDIR